MCLPRMPLTAPELHNYAVLPSIVKLKLKFILHDQHGIAQIKMQHEMRINNDTSK